MKTKLKRKKVRTISANKRVTSASHAVKQASSLKGPFARLKLLEHKHTGKLVHHRHTSHGLLMTILLVVGFLLYASGAVVQGSTLTQSGTVSVGAIVPGPTPTVGATITSPLNGAQFVDQATIEVSGTCANDTFVVVSSNNSIVGSTMCTSAGIFALQIQLLLGENVLSAMNYDGLNQPGPVTPTVTVTFIKTSVPGQSTSSPQPVLPELPANPSIIPGLNQLSSVCDKYSVPTLPIGGEPRIAFVCIPRFIELNTQYALGILVWGGSPPYALDIDWGHASDNTLLSLASVGYKKVPFSYSSSGVHTITIKLKDKDGNAAFVQAVVLVNGVTKSLISGIKDSLLQTLWFETPVPFYLLAVALTLGFWGGDIFDRRFGITKSYKKTRRRTA